MSTIQKSFPHGKWVDYDTDSIVSGLKSKLEIIAPNHLRIQDPDLSDILWESIFDNMSIFNLNSFCPYLAHIKTVKFQSDYSPYDVCYELPGRLGCCCREKKTRREKEVRLARLEASRRMVRRERKVRELDRDVLEHRTKNRGFFVGPSSTYHRDCYPRPAHGHPMSAIEDMDPDDRRIVHANSGVYYVYKLPKDTRMDDIDLSGRFLIHTIRTNGFFLIHSLIRHLNLKSTSDEICSTSRTRNFYDLPCRAHQITDYQVVPDPVNGFHLKMTKLYDPAGNKLHGRDATWWFRRENADFARTSTVVFSDN